MKIKTNVKAGDGPTPYRIVLNHNQTAALSLRVKTGIKAGKVQPQDFHFTAKVSKSTPKL